MVNAVETLRAVSDLAWGPVMMALILGTGLYLSIGLHAMPILRMPEALRLLLNPAIHKKATGAGEVSPFGALMAALSATVGVGNIAGVATAIHMGGPGAMFWMWMTALVGMATKYSETLLAVLYRKEAGGHYLGGPMYYISIGLGPKWRWLGMLFAIFASIAALGAGSSVQANSVADALQSQFNVPHWITAIVLMVATFAVVIGGLKRIAATSELLVPTMIGLFLVSGLVVLAYRITDLPDAFELIVTSAFTGHAAVGGFAGGTMALAMRFGIARGIFSNEAGLGSAAILHATARSDDPVRIGAIGMMGTFIDTLVVNSITGLVIVTTGVWTLGKTGAPLTAQGYESVLPGLGGIIVSISLVLFAFTTIIAWCVYGERSAAYLFGEKCIVPYRYLWCLVVPVGALVQLDVAWLVADITNALMAAPNLIALLLLSPVIFDVTRKRLAGGQALLATEDAAVGTQKETICP